VIIRPNAKSDRQGASFSDKWLLLSALAAVASLMIGGPLVSLNAYVPIVRAHEPWGAAALEGTATAILFFMSATGIAVGAIVDRSSARHAIVGGALLAAAGCWIAAACNGVVPFIAAFALIGVGLGAATIVPSIPLLSHAFGERRGLALGLFFGTLALSSAVLPPLTAALIDLQGWRHALHWTGAAIALASLPVTLLRVPSLRSETAAGNEPRSAAGGMTVESALSSPRYWSVVAGTTLALISAQGVLFAVVNYLSQGGVPIGRAVFLFSVANFFSVPAAPLAGLIADKVGARRVAPAGILVQALGTVALLGVFAHGGMGSAAMGAYSVLWGMACVTPGQIGPMLLEDVVGPRHFGVLLGVSTAVSGLLSAFAPMATAIFRSAGFSFGFVFAFYALMCAAAALLLLLARPLRSSVIARGGAR